MVVLELARRVGVVLLGVGAVMAVSLCYSLTVPGQHLQWLPQDAQSSSHYSHTRYSGHVADQDEVLSKTQGHRGMPASELGIEVDLPAHKLKVPTHSDRGEEEEGDLQWNEANYETVSASKVPADQPSSSHQQGPPQLHGCLDSVCLHFLSSEERTRYRECVEKTKKLAGVEEDGLDAKCHFINGSGRGLVALASFPGSGNTWIRGMLEAATGVCTGFSFCDMSMRVMGFAGENIASSAVLVVKTHMYAPSWESRPALSAVRQRLQFQSAIFVVRNPFDALVSEWNRIVANGFSKKTVTLDGHTRRVGKEYFGKL